MTDTIKKILAVLSKKEKRTFTVLVFLDVLISVLDIAFLALLLWIIQFYIQGGEQHGLRFFPAWATNRNSVALIAVFLVLFSLKNTAAVLLSWYGSRFTRAVAMRITRNNLVSYQQSGFSDFIHTDSSTHIKNISFRPFDFSQYMLSGMQQIITQLALMVVTVAAILVYNAQLFLLLLLILLPPGFIVFYLVKKRLTAARLHIQQSNEKSFQYLLDALKGFVEGNIYNRNNFFLNRFIRVRERFSKYLFDSLALQSMPSRIIELFAVLGLFLLIMIARWSSAPGTSILTVGAFIAAAYKIIPGMVKLINISGQMRAYEFSINELTTAKDSMETMSVQTAPTRIQSVSLQNVHFKYDNRTVLDRLSFDIKPGDFIGITGGSGKGKTTIMNLLVGFLPPAEGSVLYNGAGIDVDSVKAYWPHIAYVRQQGFYIHDSILMNITLEEKVANPAMLEKAILLAGLDKVISQFPEGAEKVITENGKNISGGQQQRIAIARALYKDASLLLLDEPFNELDEAATQILLEHFRQLTSEGKSVVMITHDMKSLRYCNKTICLDEQC